ncbi:hypothetical protein GCM10010387_16690 [Streptomyces inusitatus]|uniref:Lipoprotein n=1 Tax=Streptomyces inusitatus TaxID=68221 RepID=A0A918PXH4_9ACTN|nr:hypothetical protein [Streptomyces inusitatus]GGZ24057.1 hypothetical protein GCM10010387_16690 [Streptomyces inusitatus]
MPVRALLPSRRRTAVTTTVAALVLALGAAGCGGNAKDAEEAKGTAEPGKKKESSAPSSADRIWAERGVPAFRALKAASSATVDLSLDTDEGQMRAKVRSNRQNECLTVMAFAGRGTLQLIRTRDNGAYLKVNEKHIRANARGKSPERVEADIKLFSDRWMEGDPSAPQVQKSLQLCDFGQKIAQPPAGLTGAPEPRKVRENGRETLVFAIRDKDARFMVQVTAEGRPTVLKFEQTGGKDPFTALFSGYGEPVRAVRPAEKDILTKDTLTKEAARLG